MGEKSNSCDTDAKQLGKGGDFWDVLAKKKIAILNCFSHVVIHFTQTNKVIILKGLFSNRQTDDYTSNGFDLAISATKICANFCLLFYVQVF